MADVSANDISKLLDSLVFDEERDKIFDADNFEGEDELKLGEAVCSEVREILLGLHRVASSSNEI